MLLDKTRAPESGEPVALDAPLELPQPNQPTNERARRPLVCHWRKAADGALVGAWTTRDSPPSGDDLAPGTRLPTIDRLISGLNDWLSVRSDTTAAITACSREHDTIAGRLRSVDSSFFWAMQLLSYNRREAMYALYAFCRDVDDIADGNASRSLKLKLLADWRTEISRLYARRPQHPIMRTLSDAVVLFGLRCDDFLAIIDGMEMDVRADIRAPSLEELDRYCERVGVAVGRIAVRIFGEDTAAGERVAAELGRALQLTNILRDLCEDSKRARLYLPRELLQGHGIFAKTPSWVLAQPTLPDVCRDLAAVAEKHYSAALQAITGCPRHAMRPAVVMLHIYRALLHRLVAQGWKTPDARVSVPNWQKLMLLFHHGLTGR
jgi:phytoene synthase